MARPRGSFRGKAAFLSGAGLLAGLLLSGAPAHAQSLWDKAMNAVGLGGDQNAAPASQPAPATAQPAQKAQSEGKASAGVAEGKPQPAAVSDDSGDDQSRRAFGAEMPKHYLINRMTGSGGGDNGDNASAGGSGSASASNEASDGLPRKYLLNSWFGWGGRDAGDGGGAQQAPTGHIQPTQPGMWGKAMSAIGLGGGHQRLTIDYAPRPNLSVPQNLSALPAPQPRTRQAIPQPPNEAALTRPPGDYLQEVRGPNGKIVNPKHQGFLGLF